MKKTVLSLLGFLLLCYLPLYAVDGVGVATGIFRADLEYQDDYKGAPVLVPLFFTLADSGRGAVELIVEPFISAIFEPEKNVEAGANVLLNYVLPLTPLFKPYLKGGVGVLYMSQHTGEQGSQCNFLPQAGMGFRYFFNKHKAFDFECRYRHLSNCGIKYPNKGINSLMFLAGIDYYFN